MDIKVIILSHEDYSAQFDYPESIAEYPFVYVDRDTWDAKDKADQEALLNHETIHIKQQEVMGGATPFKLKYDDDNAFRMRVEVEAYGAQIQAMLKKNISSTKIIDEIATKLSSKAYNFMCSYDNACTALKIKYGNILL